MKGNTSYREKLLVENTNNGGDITSRRCWCSSPTGITSIVGGNTNNGEKKLLVENTNSGESNSGGNTNNGHKIIYRYTSEKDVTLHCNPPLLVFSTNRHSVTCWWKHQQGRVSSTTLKSTYEL